MDTHRFNEVNPNLVWGDKKKTEVTGSDLFKPWTDLRKFPEFSYKTTSQISLPLINETPRYFKLPKEDTTMKDQGYKYQISKTHYNTTTKTSYVSKTVPLEPGEKPSFLDYIEELKQKLQTKLFLLPSFSTEYLEKYPVHKYDAGVAGLYKEQASETFCKSPTVAKEMQPLQEQHMGGTRRELDIYNSFTHYTHHYFPREKLYITKDSDDVQSTGVTDRSPPMDAFLRLPFRQVTLLKKTHPVPYSGMTTEVRDNYIPQVDWFERYEEDIDLTPKISKPNLKENMIREMDKFHTDYDHIGHDWSPLNI